MKKTLYWILTLLFPFLLLGLIEIFLRIGGYNEEAQGLFVEVPAQPEYLTTNSDFVSRYFPSFKPQVGVSPFLKNKKEDSFRVFVLGGSSTQGFPYNFYYSFAEQLEQKLLLNTEGINVEVINLGMTAVNSYVIRDLSKRLMEYKPDAIIIYAGHNEYYGSFGAGSTQFGLLNYITLKRVVLSLKNLRLYQFLENLLKPPAPKNNNRRTMMAEVIKESEIEVGGDVFESGIEQYEMNMSDVLDHFNREGVPVYIGSVASNLKDQAPLSENNVANEKYSEGQNLYNSGDKKAALEKFIEAKEADLIRFRAPNEINSTISKLAVDYSATLVNVKEMLRRSSLGDIEDESLFIDHLHPNFKGHKLIADLFYEHLLELEKINNAHSPNEFSVPDSISEFEKAYAATTISRLLVGYPFQKNLTVAEESEKFEVIYKNFLNSSYTDSIAAFTKVNQKSVPLALNDIVDHKKKEGDTLAAMSHYYELLKWQLNNTNLIEKVIEYAINNPKVNTYLVNIIEQSLNEGAYDPRYMNVLSSVYMDNGAPEKAKYWMDESLRLSSNEPVLFYNLTRYYLSKKDTLKAGEYYQKFMEARQQ
jgi:lysophospholipase L1-like esterase